MDVFKYILFSIELIVFAYLMFATIYVFIFGVAGVFYSDKKKNDISKLRKFAVLIPGYKEDAVIVNVARQALVQDYPKDKYEVIVIADSFEQKTLDALNALPIRVVVVEFEVSKKSKALNKCMSVIGDDYDVAFILDADNIMEKDVLTRINAAFDMGYQAVQGHRTAKNLNANFAILDAMSEEINNNIFRRGHRVLGFSSALIGSGMGIDYALFKKTMATVDSVGEDKEVELKLLKQRYKIEYVHKAIIYDEKTSKSDVFVTQRRRWIAAQLDYFRNYFFDGLANLLTKGNIDYFDKVIQMIQPPRIMLTGILVIIVALLSLLFIPSLDFLQEYIIPGYWYWFSLFALTALALLFSIPTRFYNFRTFVALLRVPMGFVLMIVSLFKIKGATKKFLHTTHSHVDDEKQIGNMASNHTYFPLVSIITVNFNQAEVTCALIESLNKISYPNFEIIVVDNNSTEDDPSIIKERYPNIIFIQNPINYGFAAGNNFGLMRARGEYVMLLNNDIEVPRGFLEPLVDKLKNNPKIGAVSPKIKFYYQPDTIQYAGYTPINNITMRNFAIGYWEKDKGQYDKDRETAYAHGAAMLVPIEVVKKVGLMSYIFFLYYEEADWCARIAKAGYSMYYVHNSHVLHKESVSTGKLSALKIYYLNRNRIVFMRRNNTGKEFYYGIIYQLFVAIPKNAFKYLAKGKVKLFLAYYRAIGWHLKNLFSSELHENPSL